MELVRRNSRKLKNRLSRRARRRSTVFAEPDACVASLPRKSRSDPHYDYRTVSFEIGDDQDDELDLDVDLDVHSDKTLHENHQLLNELYEGRNNTIPHSQSFNLPQQTKNSHTDTKNHRKSPDTLSAWFKFPRQRKNSVNPLSTVTVSDGKRKSIDYASLQHLKSKGHAHRIVSEPLKRPQSLVLTPSDPSYQSIQYLSNTSLASLPYNSKKFSKSTSAVNLFHNQPSNNSSGIFIVNNNNNNNNSNNNINTTNTYLFSNTQSPILNDTDKDSIFSSTSSRHIKFDSTKRLSIHSTLTISKIPMQNTSKYNLDSSLHPYSNIDYYRSTSLSSTIPISVGERGCDSSQQQSSPSSSSSSSSSLSSTSHMVFAVLFYLFNIFFTFPCYCVFKLGFFNVSIILFLFLCWWYDSNFILFRILNNYLTLNSDTVDNLLI